MRYEIVDSDAGPTLVLREQLVFADRPGFDAVIDKLLARKKPRVTIDMNRLDYMDSAGLGMLLTLRDRADRMGVGVRLTGARAEVRDLLELACFHTLFAIEPA